MKPSLAGRPCTKTASRVKSAPNGSKSRFSKAPFSGARRKVPGSGALKRSATTVLGADVEMVIRFATELNGSTVAQIEASQVDERKEALKKKAMGHPRVIEALKVFPELSTKQDVQVDPD
jgi:hypothetical protein